MRKPFKPSAQMDLVANLPTSVKRAASRDASNCRWLDCKQPWALQEPGEGPLQVSWPGHLDLVTSIEFANLLLSWDVAGAFFILGK